LAAPLRFSHRWRPRPNDGRLTDEQRNFLEQVRCAGGIAIEARDVDTTLAQINEQRTGNHVMNDHNAISSARSHPVNAPSSGSPSSRFILAGAYRLTVDRHRFQGRSQTAPVRERREPARCSGSPTASPPATSSRSAASSGEPGDSLSVNLNTGQWSDFANKRAPRRRPDRALRMVASRAAGAGDQGSRLAGQAQGFPRRGGARAARASTRAHARRAGQRPQGAAQNIEVDARSCPCRTTRLRPPIGSRSNEGTPEDSRAGSTAEFVRRWTYHDADGRTLGHVARFEWPKVDSDTGEILGRDKDVVPQTWCVRTKPATHKWRTRSLPRASPAVRPARARRSGPTPRC
jgi:hypothetical protein